MTIHVFPSALKGTIDAIPSKTYAHRILIAAALCAGETVVRNLYPSVDILSTMDCLSSLGVQFIPSNKADYRVIPPSIFPKTAVFSCRESGSTLRFLLPVAAALGIDTLFTGENRLPFRPLDDLNAVLRQNGCTVTVDASNGSLPLRLSGQLAGTTFSVNSGVSSQYVSGLLFACAALGGTRTVILRGKTVSKGYLDITADVLQIFGATVTPTLTGYTVSTPKKLLSPMDITVEGDYSNAAFFLVSGILNGKIEINGLNPHSVQGDAAVIALLRRMGGQIDWTEHGSLLAQKSPLHGIEADCTDTPDLIPVMSVAAAFADGKSVFAGADRLTDKECDRLSATREMLAKSGIATDYSDGKLTVYGGIPHFGKFSCQSDHRMIMSATVLSNVVGGQIDDGTNVKKSYPTFFTAFTSLGGTFSRDCCTTKLLDC